MGNKDFEKKRRLRVHQVLDVPLRELSGICLRRDANHQRSLIAVGDRVATVAWTSVPPRDAREPQWRTVDISRLVGSQLPVVDSQLEAVCADGAGRVLLLQETPPRAEFVDLEAAQVLASISLDVRGDTELARSWFDPDCSRGEGAVLLPGGHLLVAKEKNPPAFIEFGPSAARSRGFAPDRGLPDGAPWPIDPGRHRFVALATWHPDKALRKACADFSDLEIGPDGRLYLLSDKSAAIARLADLPPGGGDAPVAESWKLDDVDGKPEGLAFDATGRAVVALDKGKPRNNLVIFEPAIAAPSESGD